MENPHEERQSLLLERIIKNVDLLNDALLELDRSVAEINAHNQDITIAAELWEGVSVVWAAALSGLARALWEAAGSVAHCLWGARAGTLPPLVSAPGRGGRRGTPSAR